MVEKVPAIGSPVFTNVNSKREVNTSEPVMSFASPDAPNTSSPSAPLTGNGVDPNFKANSDRARARAKADGEEVADRLQGFSWGSDYDEVRKIIMRQTPETIMSFLSGYEYYGTDSPLDYTKLDIMDQISTEWGFDESGKKACMKHIKKMVLQAMEKSGAKHRARFDAYERLKAADINAEGIDDLLSIASGEYYWFMGGCQNYGYEESTTDYDTYIDDYGVQRYVLDDAVYDGVPRSRNR